MSRRRGTKSNRVKSSGSRCCCSSSAGEDQRFPWVTAAPPLQSDESRNCCCHEKKCVDIDLVLDLVQLKGHTKPLGHPAAAAFGRDTSREGRRQASQRRRLLLHESRGRDVAGDNKLHEPTEPPKKHHRHHTSKQTISSHDKRDQVPSEGQSKFSPELSQATPAAPASVNCGMFPPPLPPFFGTPLVWPGGWSPHAAAAAAPAAATCVSLPPVALNGLAFTTPRLKLSPDGVPNPAETQYAGYSRLCEDNLFYTLISVFPKAEIRFD